MALSLDLWLRAQAGTIRKDAAILRTLWPARAKKLSGLAQEYEARAHEAQRMRVQLDQIVEDAWLEARDAAPAALEALDAVVAKWKLGPV